MSTMTMRMPDELMRQLNALAEATGRSKTFLATEAVKDYIKREAWQIAEIQKAIKEADAGDFASDKEMAADLDKWAKHAD